jgi:hypothetical protein
LREKSIQINLYHASHGLPAKNPTEIRPNPAKNEKVPLSHFPEKRLFIFLKKAPES